MSAISMLMPRFDQKSYVNPLTNQQVADISNYVLASYGNPDLRVTPADVQQSRDGGPVPLLAKAQPYLVPGGVAVPGAAASAAGVAAGMQASVALGGSGLTICGPGRRRTELDSATDWLS